MKPTKNNYAKNNKVVKSGGGKKSKEGKKIGFKKAHTKVFKGKNKNFLKKKKFDKKPEVKSDQKQINLKDSKKRKLLTSEDEVIKKKKRSQPEIISNLMTIYEQLRRKSSSQDGRRKLIDDVLKIVQGKEAEVVYKHDTVRVLEMCIKFGSEIQKEKLFQLFQDNTILLVTSKYSKFLIEKFFKHGSKEQKNKIIESFYGKITKLIRNKVISGQTVGEILSVDGSEKKKAILKHMKESLTALCQKDVVTHSIIHKVLFQFFTYADLQQKIDLIEILKENVIHILHTKDGARIAMNCFWFASVKDRKAIIKSFKTYVLKICKEEYGHMVMLALFDTVDDTVLVKKAIFPEIIANLQELIEDSWGRKVILYLLKPRSKSYFSPDLLKILQEGDNNPYSKKEAKIKQEELRQGILTHVLDVMSTYINKIVINKSAAIVLLAALEVSNDLPQYEKLLNEIAAMFGGSSKKNNENEELVTNECAHFVLKTIIKQDLQRIERDSKILFSNILCKAVPQGCFADWAVHNRGAFILVSLLETGIKAVITRVKEDMGFVKKNKNSELSKGCEILHKLLSKK
ncbi:pumilio homolog 3 isoform X2 [Hydra vulgaris]|uniref:pumilio homolog 3 isoform X2 n=1 Tax=Hydra vulgaris TaxID=6087 RepID=UPI001F5FAEA8|nr:pumilio homolog 3 isoform X2 [Hydra vulgaris]